MTTFIQLHLLTAYPAANLNRDDTGAPKTVTIGGASRLRISSQSLKRAWRTSSLFEEALSGHIGTRTARIGREAAEIMLEGGVGATKAVEWGGAIARCFGKVKSEKDKNKLEKDPLINTETEQLAHVSPTEREAVQALARTLATENRAPKAEELSFLRKDAMAVDIALFGRMLASTPEYNIEAACQVAHAFGVGETLLEDDFFTAVDDLRQASAEEAGAGHIGELGFGSALFYTYLCIDRDRLLENLNGDEKLLAKTLRALGECTLKISPTGKQNSFASRAYASWALAEKSTEQPRSLAAAFWEPVTGTDQLEEAVRRITTLRDNMNNVYGGQQTPCATLYGVKGEGSVAQLLDFISA
ncbi:type I-E CRISPR-associated protein Cas7/Cse4/CasC [Cronobacter muytjensii]|uniref:Type I-E CRISPR-associated protein Cas7/Cse4/CasC n=1 Tax=Cronobacter muytjensii TaxID=413501 RepID=A0A2T7AIX4_9ENTR|nr:type I-E CRISPR-associated protein Cas7/Cse4/CasC [Cronobacter muytjensii]KAB0881687.1 type I-E CRISPR-associated protein Cas7/Cse4/CasC [Cronobacter muytjensii]MBF4813274.1 type I-E CRISPR-associated protein Cas7/Cse4/CasC [Cronobacter muytjensii]PUX08087.1 type I-E CRISPR-associated protein Cas7/Cse4/CasC [Cronobacter muytjensii]